MPNISSTTCTDSELSEVERDLAAKGIRPVAKTDQKELLPNEYMKSSYLGTEKSFEGPKKWTITIRVQ